MENAFAFQRFPDSRGPDYRGSTVFSVCYIIYTNIIKERPSSRSAVRSGDRMFGGFVWRQSRTVPSDLSVQLLEY